MILEYVPTWYNNNAYVTIAKVPISVWLFEGTLEAEQKNPASGPIFVEQVDDSNHAPMTEGLLKSINDKWLLNGTYERGGVTTVRAIPFRAEMFVGNEILALDYHESDRSGMTKITNAQIDLNAGLPTTPAGSTYFEADWMLPLYYREVMVNDDEASVKVEIMQINN